ncbi:MAG: hypothetical protein AAGD14_09735 [Planctomycetota bacterium]
MGISVPERLRRGLKVGEDGLHTWDLAQVPAVIEAARAEGLANLGGTPHLRIEADAAPMHALRWAPEAQADDETWSTFVHRSASEAKQRFRARCEEEQLRSAARGVRFARAHPIEPLRDVRAVLQFAGADGAPFPPIPAPPERRPRRTWGWYLLPPLTFLLTFTGALASPMIGGPLFVFSVFACLMATLDLLFWDPEVNWPGRIVLATWNVGALMLVFKIATDPEFLAFLLRVASGEQ